jgi:hypothetical protein
VILCAIANLYNDLSSVTNALDEVVGDPLQVVQGCGELASFGVTLQKVARQAAAREAAAAAAAAADRRQNNGQGLITSCRCSAHVSLGATLQRYINRTTAAAAAAAAEAAAEAAAAAAMISTRNCH